MEVALFCSLCALMGRAAAKVSHALTLCSRVEGEWNEVERRAGGLARWPSLFLSATGGAWCRQLSLFLEGR